MAKYIHFKSVYIHTLIKNRERISLVRVGWKNWNQINFLAKNLIIKLMKLIKTYETLLVLFWHLLDNDSKSVLFLNDGWENHTTQASSHHIPLNLCSPPGQHPLAKVNYQPTLPHPLSVYKPPSAEKGRWFKAVLMSPGEPHAPGPRSELLWFKGYCLAPSLSKLCLF